MDLYKILGVTPDASQEAIKKAYREAARRYHPDTAADPDPERFRQVKEAYDILRDPKSRKEYDRRRQLSTTYTFSYHPYREDWIGESFEEAERLFEHLDAIFNFFFSREWPPGRRRRRPRASDVGLRLILTPEEAAAGGVVRVPLSFRFQCPSCAGQGFTVFGVCSQCRGSGIIKFKRSIPVKIEPGIADGTIFQIPLSAIGLSGTFLRVIVEVSE